MTDKSVCLHGHKVTVRSIEEADLPRLWTLIYGQENPEWKQWDAPYFPLTHVPFESFAEKMRMRRADIPLSLCVIEVAGQIIGDVSFYWESKETRWLEMGIVIFEPAFWSGGYGTDALSLWADYLFDALPVARVGLTTWSGNARMVRVAEKLGMQMEGRMRRCRYYNGTYYDSIRMGILREEWAVHKGHRINESD